MVFPRLVFPRFTCREPWGFPQVHIPRTVGFAVCGAGHHFFIGFDRAAGRHAFHRFDRLKRFFRVALRFEAVVVLEVQFFRFPVFPNVDDGSRDVPRRDRQPKLFSHVGFVVFHIVLLLLRLGHSPRVLFPIVARRRRRVCRRWRRRGGGWSR